MTKLVTLFVALAVLTGVPGCAMSPEPTEVAGAATELPGLCGWVETDCSPHEQPFPRAEALTTGLAGVLPEGVDPCEQAPVSGLLLAKGERWASWAWGGSSDATYSLVPAE